MTREEAIKILKALNLMMHRPDGTPVSDGCEAIDMAIEALVLVSDAIKLIPSAEPKTGEWIQKDMCADRFCSECNYAVWDSEAEEYNFCPNCGARMRGGEDE